MRDQLSADQWLIREQGLDVAAACLYETLFTLGNGYLGTRGTLEEGRKGELSGTYLNGVFDAHDSPVIDLVNAPDWLPFVVRAGGVRLDTQSCRVVSHERALDLRQGALWRKTVFEDRESRRTRLESLRFASLHDRHLCALRVRIAPENHADAISVCSGIDGRRFNLERLPTYRGGVTFHPEVRWEKWARSKHLDEVAKAALPEAIYLEMRTIDTGIGIGYAATLSASLQPLRRSVLQDYERIEEQVEFALDPGQMLELDKLVAIHTSRDRAAGTLRTRCLATLAAAEGFDAAIAGSRTAWQRKWAECDIAIVGDPEANRAARFGIYHLLIAANEDDPTVNIGAKSLSGEAYRGHVFWDTEIFLLPFFIYTQPATARSLLSYRYHTLDGARENARRNGFRGAQFAWESADTGIETTPQWTPDGQHRIWTGEEEIHVTADVAYGVLTYVAATGDMAFMLDEGAEILFETSRFWADRLQPAADRYVLTRVIGPDEFHEHVDNNAFTNRMAQWHLVQSARIHRDLAKHHPDALARVAAKIGLSRDEVAAWTAIAEKVLVPFDPDRGLIEQFEGYFSLKEVPVIACDQNDMPCYPPGYDHSNAGETTLVKQPDALMLIHMLPDEFSARTKRANYAYYEPRTLHKSSLSPSIHAILSIEVGDPARALHYFRRSAFVDLANNQGNTQDGMHAASAGGTWLSLVSGFGGFRVIRSKMTFKPWLPEGWSELRFRLKWHGNTLDVIIEHGRASFLLHAPDGTAEEIVVFGRPVIVEANVQTVVNLPVPEALDAARGGSSSTSAAYSSIQGRRTSPPGSA